MMNLLKLWLTRQESQIIKEEHFSVYQYSVDKRIDFFDRIFSTPLVFLSFPIAVVLALTEGHPIRHISLQEFSLPLVISLLIIGILVINLLHNVRRYYLQPTTDFRLNKIAISSNDKEIIENNDLILNDQNLILSKYRFVKLNKINNRYQDQYSKQINTYNFKIFRTNNIIEFAGNSISFDLKFMEDERAILPVMIIIVID